jgi:hypothetical protein
MGPVIIKIPTRSHRRMPGPKRRASRTVLSLEERMEESASAIGDGVDVATDVRVMALAMGFSFALIVLIDCCVEQCGSLRVSIHYEGSLTLGHLGMRSEGCM